MTILLFYASAQQPTYTVGYGVHLYIRKIVSICFRGL